jgi:hypothetical protein
MDTPTREPNWRSMPEVEAAVQRFVTLIRRTLEHVDARRLNTAKFSMSPSTAMRVLVGVPAEELRETVSAVGRIQAHLSRDGTGAESAKAELERLLEYWTNGW